MQVQVNTDNHIEGSEGLRNHVESVIEDSLSWIADRVTRVEVFLRDENSDQKNFGNDSAASSKYDWLGKTPSA